MCEEELGWQIELNQYIGTFNTNFTSNVIFLIDWDGRFRTPKGVSLLVCMVHWYICSVHYDVINLKSVAKLEGVDSKLLNQNGYYW